MSASPDISITEEKLSSSNFFSSASRLRCHRQIMSLETLNFCIVARIFQLLQLFMTEIIRVGSASDSTIWEFIDEILEIGRIIFRVKEKFGFKEISSIHRNWGDFFN